MNEQITLAGVQWRFSEGEHDDADVRWLLAEVDRLQALADQRMNRAIGAASIADRVQARLDAVEAFATAMEADAKYLREEYGRTGSDWTLSYANCTQIDAKNLRRVLAGADIDGYCTCDDDLALATTCGVKEHREKARALSVGEVTA